MMPKKKRYLYKAAPRGTTKNYYDYLEDVARQNWRKWGYPSEDLAYLNVLNDNAYNYKEYYNNTPSAQRVVNSNTHWPDTYKTVYHPTFSTESKYSGNKSQYNPNGLIGGRWIGGDIFLPALWQLNDKSRLKYRNGGTIHTITKHPPIRVIKRVYENGGDIKKDPYAPIKGYKTKGYDTETTQWLFDWLNNRRKILLDNYNNYGYALSKYTTKENKDIRDTKFERGKVNTMYNPIDYFRGYDPNRTKLNKILYTEIENAGSAPETNIPDNYGNMPVEPSYGTLGLYAEPDNWSGTGHYIAYLGYPSKTTKIHERTHAMNASPQHDAISKIITKSEDEYLDNPKEIYARLMQYRYNNELKPTDIIDKNYLNKNREKLKELELDRYKDEELIRLFNEVAQNDINKNNLDAIRFYGKNGGTIHINPANRGKFNATKRRTGKTTEELTHSKNPKTRKRAIFAQNAAKWRKRG